MAQESDMRSVSLLSVKSEDSATAAARARWRNAALHERCSMTDMTKMKEAFTEAYNKKMTQLQFRAVLKSLLDVDYDDENFNILFMKVNTSRTGEVDWEEVVSHLILGYFGNDAENQRESLQPAIMGLPVVIRSQHRHPISRITFSPDVDKAKAQMAAKKLGMLVKVRRYFTPEQLLNLYQAQVRSCMEYCSHLWDQQDALESIKKRAKRLIGNEILNRTTDPMQGTYITASRDGMINWWSLDMKLLRTAFSSSPHLKVRTTWVTDMVCMPDVNIIVTSSTERDLRFYDCTAKTFTLKIVITSWEFMICTMYYHFGKELTEQCMLICGDVGGNIRLLLFSPVLRGPFQNEPGRATQSLRHIDLQKKPQLLPKMQLVDMQHMHAEWVRQVSYYKSLSCVVSCSTCYDSLLIHDVHGSNRHSMFRVEKGIQCFAFDEERHVMVTGGPDCVVRVWNAFIPSKPSLILIGHHAGITCIVLQNKGQTIYSLSRDRTIKVWDVQSQACIQTYIDIPAIVGERTPISAVYNPATREFILACMKIATVVLDEQLNPLHTDGFTHSRAVSQIIYNPLFKIIITCGMDSIIINWNPITGKRNVLIRDAHVRKLHGEEIPVEITASCLDPGYLLLLTGARNGELKVWNFNTGVCIRQMFIEHMCEVTGCFWVEGRILATGWNRHVVEFEDTGMSTTGKSWETRHTDDVLAAAVRPPLTLATTSYNSEMVLWKLETGQPYRQFSCTEPMLRIKMVYNKRELQKSAQAGGVKTRKGSGGIRMPGSTGARDVVDSEAAIKKAIARRQSPVEEPPRERKMRHLAVHAVIFLKTRPQHMHVAALLLALENGQVQCWSDHSAGGYQGSFQAIHMAGDYVSAFATDENNEFLFTGTTMGYIKVWLLTNYLSNETVHVNMPRLRLLFPFLWRDRIEGRAKRSTRDQPLPIILNSYRAHMRCVTTIAYIDEHKLVFTGSSDYSVRVWRLTGEYLQTLGSFLPWSLEVTRFPPDVKKVASFTTFKVWRGGEVSRYVPGQLVIDKLRDITEKELQQKTFGAPPDEPLLGKYFALPLRPERQDTIVLDDSMQTIPLYAHLRMASTVPVRRPPTPELVRQTRLKRSLVKKRPGDSERQLTLPPEGSLPDVAPDQHQSTS